MTYRLVPLLLFLCLPGGVAYSQGLGCGTAKDYVVQAREKARPSLNREEMENIRLRLNRAIDLCPYDGEAYYYRYLFERQLGHEKDAAYSLRKAVEFGSEGLTKRIDLFPLPQPAGRSVAISPVVREKWALVVGISNFANKIPPLHFAAKDAADFAAFLRDPNYGRFKAENVTLLTDSQASTARIKEELNKLARSATPDDLVVLFISTHGSPRESDTGGVSYVVTYDTDASNPDHLYATALPMIDIVGDMRTRVKAQRAVVFLDTCFSGEAATRYRVSSAEAPVTRTNAPSTSLQSGAGSKSLQIGAGVSADALNGVYDTPGRVVITASQPDERSWESEKLRNGYFTFHLIQALKQNNGRSSIEQIYGYLRDHVPRQVLAELNVSQTPMMSPAKPNTDISLGVDTHSR